MDKVILVTGANGFIGRRLVHALHADKAIRVVAADLQKDSAAVELAGSANFEYIQADVGQGDSAARLIPRYHFSAIVHLAGILGKNENPESIAQGLNANLQSTLMMLEVAKAHKSRFLFPSTGLVYGNRKPPFAENMPVEPGSFYAQVKHFCEQSILRYYHKDKIPYIILRPSVLFGPGQSGEMFIPSSISAMLSGKEFPMTHGEQKRDFLYIDDFLRALIMALASEKCGIYNVGSQKSIRMIEVARMIEQLCGVTGKVKPGAILQRDNEVMEYCLSRERIEKDLGWSPTVHLEAGLAKCVEWARAHTHAHPQ